MKEKQISRSLLSISENGKIQPQAIDLEEAVLGACMIQSGAFDCVAQILKYEMFYKMEHQMVYKAINDLANKNSKIDILTVTEQLKKNGHLEQVGGAYAIAMLTNRVVSSANIEVHARIIIQKHIQRELIRVSSEVICDAYEDTTDVFELIDIADKNIQAINELTTEGGGMKHISDLITKV
jgi:replicative DNA helicase